jgi:NADH:ubiquinone oxidoreductase subunit C
MVEKEKDIKPKSETIVLNNNDYTYAFLTSLHSQLINLFDSIFSNKAIFYRYAKNEFEVVINMSDLLVISNFFKNHTLLGFKQLVEIAAIDRPGKQRRFKLNYILLNYLFNSRVILSTEVTEVDMPLSLVKLYKSAEWLEREVWDLFGIHFDGNPDLRRIITDYGFKGHPLRKDFPLTGFLEIYYNDEEKKIVYEPVELAQEYRVFCLRNP